MNLLLNKKFLIWLSIICLVCIGLIISIKFNRSIPDQATSEEGRVVGVASRAFEFTSLDHYIGYADHIVYGKVSSISPFEKGSSEYVFEIERQLKGDTQSKVINVYKEDHAMETGGKYLLFLEVFEGGLYPSPVYKVLDIDGLVKMESGRVEHRNRFLAKDIAPETLLADIEASPSIKKFRVKDATETSMIVKESATTEGLIDSSDVVARIQPESILKKNKYMTFANIRVLEQLKGESKIPEDAIVCLPADVETGKSYLVFLQQRNGMYIVSTKIGSVIQESDKDEWKEALMLIHRE